MRVCGMKAAVTVGAILLGALPSSRAVDGDAYWGPNGLAAGPDFFAPENLGNHSSAARVAPAEPPAADDAQLTQQVLEALAATERPTPIGVHVALHSWCLAAVLPAAIGGQRYGRRAFVKILFDVAAAAFVGAGVAIYALPPPAPVSSYKYAAIAGVLGTAPDNLCPPLLRPLRLPLCSNLRVMCVLAALAPAVALILVALRRTYGRMQWQRQNTKSKQESPTKGMLGGGSSDDWGSGRSGAWRRWEVWVLLSACGAGQTAALMAALAERGGLVCGDLPCWTGSPIQGGSLQLLLQGAAALACTDAGLAILAAFVGKSLCARPLGKMSIGARMSLSAAVALAGASLVAVTAS